ncbi:MAG TPA: hypothetical protein VKA53_02840 [Thermoanaerobaculia bacterium]|nr:hypothetical protein [Thermoanaerobaculia bacterium]
MIEFYGAVAFLVVGVATLMMLVLARNATDGLKPAAAFGMAVSGLCTAILVFAAAVDHARAWGSFRTVVTLFAAASFAAASTILLGRWFRDRRAPSKFDRS